MHTESETLRGLDHLFSSNTIFSLLVGMLFLWLVTPLSNKFNKWIPIRWLSLLVSAWCSFMIIISMYALIQLFVELIQSFRLKGNAISIANPQPLLTRGAFISLVLAFIYLIYFSITEKLKEKIDHVTLGATLSAFTALVLLCLPVIGWNIYANLRHSNHTAIAFAIATTSAEIVGASLAVFVRTYLSYVNTYRIRQKELQIARLQQQVAQSQLDALSSKINPHFLYNSLNSIAGLATEDGLRTREMAIALSKLFRYNINRQDNNFATVAEEMEMVNLYLRIEQIRFEERMRFKSTIESGLEDELIPMHLLQPLVENSVKYGSSEDGIDINIHISKQDQNIVLSVRDKGKAFEGDFSPGYGLKSLYDKLDILVPDNYEIAFLNNPKEVRITMSNLKPLIS